jgi:hypothetical protein
MLALAVPAYEHELVSRPVERAHAAIALNPHADIDQIAARLANGGLHLGQMAPIHKGVDEGARLRMRHGQLERFAEKLSEFSLVHLARRHGEFSMPGRAGSADMAVDFDVVWRSVNMAATRSQERIIEASSALPQNRRC